MAGQPSLASWAASPAPRCATAGCCGVTDQQLALAKLLVTAVMAVVLILAMTWIIVTPVSDEATKGALVIIGSAVGFIFGRETAR